MKRSLALIEKHFRSRDAHEGWCFSYFQRLNIAGYDYRGQMSSAYGQSGFGLSFGTAADFGALMGPFFHLEVGADVSGRRTAHTLLLLHRVPAAVWWKHHLKPPQRRTRAQRHALERLAPGTKASRHTPLLHSADWVSDRPLMFGVLRGSTWDTDATASASAWAGIGSAFGDDETGVGAGLRVEGGVLGSRTRLADPAPRHYAPSAMADIKADIDALFAESVKRKAIAWITMVALGVKEAAAMGTPIMPERHRARKYGNRLSATTIEALDAWDTHDTHGIDRNVGGLLSSLVRGVVGIGKRVHTAATTRGTSDLIAEVGALNAALQKLLDNSTETRILRRIAAAAQANPGLRPAEDSPDALALKVARQTNAAIRQRMTEGEALIEALTVAYTRKTFGNEIPPPLPPLGRERPLLYLDINVFGGHGEIEAGGKIVMPRVVGNKKPRGDEDDEGRMRVVLSLQGSFHAKRIAFRYGSYAPGTRGRKLLSTQDTVTTYNTYGVKKEATARFRGRARTKGTESDTLAFRTMAYRSVLVNWFDDTRPYGHQALPNGSGISFGVSALLARLLVYRDAARAAQGGGAMPDKENTAFETMLCKQLRLTTAQARAFGAGIPDWLNEDLDFGASMLVESAFAIIRPEPLVITDNRPQDLLTLHIAKSLLDGGRPAPGTALQSIRLRYRIRSDEDRTRNLFQIGINLQKQYTVEEDGDPADIGEDLARFDQFQSIGKAEWLEDFTLPTTMAQMNLGGERVTRVGAEGIITVHEQFHPERYSRHLYSEELAQAREYRNYARNAEILVPPVQLFSQ